METYELKWTNLQTQIFKLLCIKTGQALNQREIALELNVSPTAVSKALKGLDNFVKVEKNTKMNLTSVQLDRDNQKVIELKRVENLKQIYTTGLSDFLEDKFPGCVIILFGSYSMGEDIVQSDIDIAVIGSKEKNINLFDFEKLLKRAIIINYYKDLKNINKNLKQNIVNGITLHGIVEI